jgi:hypothetical protein
MVQWREDDASNKPRSVQVVSISIPSVPIRI